MKNYISLLILTLSTNLIAQKNYIQYHTNGELKVKGELIDGKKNGLWEAYDSDKNLIIKRNYENNILVKNFLSDIELKKTIPKQEDVLWSKRVWRILPSSSDKNKALYNSSYLSKLLLKSIRKNKIKSYNSLKLDSILSQKYALQKAAKIDFRSSSFKLKEDWFFNKKTNTMEVLITGFSITDENNKKTIGFYFPELKKQIGKEEITLEGKKTTFENYFRYRLFQSEIIDETKLMEREMTKERAKEIDQLLLDTEVDYWFKKK